MLRDKTKDGTTIITGPDATSDPIYWYGQTPNEASNSTAGWVNHTQVPVVTTANDPNGAYTPVAGGIQFNFPGTYEVEAIGTFTPTVDGIRTGFAFYTSGGIQPPVNAGSTPLGGFIIGASGASTPFYVAKTTVVVSTAGAKVLMQNYYQSATARVVAVPRLHVVKLTQGAPGPQGLLGPQGNVGPTGPVGTRWGSTNQWVLGTASNAGVMFPDGGPPRVGDLVVGTNGFDPGQVSIVTAVVDATHADLSTTLAGQAYPNLRGPQGPSGNTNITLNNISITTDLNTLTETGFYELINNNATANAPGGYTNGFLTVAGTGNDTTQTFQVRGGDRFYHRSRNAGVWTAWRELQGVDDSGWLLPGAGGSTALQSGFVDANTGANYRCRFKRKAGWVTVALAFTKSATAGIVFTLGSDYAPAVPVFTALINSAAAYAANAGFSVQPSGAVSLNSSGLTNGTYYGSVSYPLGA